MIFKRILTSKYLFLIFLVLGQLHIVPAQQTPNSFKLKDVFQLLEENNLSLQQLESRIHQFELELTIQKTGYLPIISSSVTYNHVSELAKLEIPFQLPGLVIPVQLRHR